MTDQLPKHPPLIQAPVDPGAWNAWRKELDQWRDDARSEVKYDGSTYSRPEFAWMQRCFAFGKVMMFEREFVDPERGEFKVESWLDSMNRDFGGLDALILWQAYPRIGVDRRNQFDHYRDVPGGLTGLKDLVARLHARKVRAALAYNPWDVGTRREPKSDAEAIAELVGEVGFDGVFLDTMPQGGPDLRASVDRVRQGVVLESELALPIEAISTHHASWAQWFDDSRAPGAMRNCWFEQRHMMHLIRRWDLDHTGELQMAWMNGAGTFIWQNIFGSWNGWSGRDRSILASMLPIQRRYAAHFSEGLWTPLVEASGTGIYASSWVKDGITLWTAVNRDEEAREGFVQSVSNDGATRLFDLVRGIELDHAHLQFAPRGVGALVAIPSSRVDDSFKAFLGDQAERHARANHDRTRIEPMPVRRGFERAKVRSLPSGMVAIRDGRHRLVSKFRVRECGEYGHALLQYVPFPGLHGERQVERSVSVGKVAVARREITNDEFHRFLRESGYRPTSKEHFLVHWEGSRPKSGEGDKPVVNVSLDDARAYASWAGLRLPTEDEWQLAADQRGWVYGTIWNWTESMHDDGHSTFSILKGGCDWESKGSGWYYDSGHRPPEWSAKYIHFWPGLDRSETIGFRCAADLE